MSDAPRAIKATFADWRTVKGRKQLQLIFEVPMEQQAEVLTMLGAPMAADPKWCGIALLEQEKGGGADRRSQSNDKTGAGDGKRQWSDLPPAQQAAMRCNEPRFWAFLNEKVNEAPEEITTAQMAADCVRWQCEVMSRAELNTMPRSAARWRDLDGRYQAWLAT